MSDALHRAEQAERLLNDPLLSECLQTLKRETQELFFALGSQASQEREFLHLMDRARQQFEGLLVALIAHGKIERSAMLAEENTKLAAELIRERVRSR
jgi:hypothetical protein